MKKCIIFLSLFLCLLCIGCTKTETETTHLQSVIDYQDISMTVDIELVHDGEVVYEQNQQTVSTFSDSSKYDEMLSYYESLGLADYAKEYDGAEYQITENSDQLTITEIINLDFTKLSAEGYQKMTLGQATPEENYYIDYQQMLDSLTNQGFEVIE